jgi:hypothetical protein
MHDTASTVYLREKIVERPILHIRKLKYSKLLNIALCSLGKYLMYTQKVLVYLGIGVGFHPPCLGARCSG